MVVLAGMVFFTAYEMTDVPPTPVETLHRAREIGLEVGLRYVYVGNVPGEANTACHACGKMLIRRSGLRVVENRVGLDGRCPDCGALVAGVGMAGVSGR
jgi:pyruvate formate lyase activating enzyme